MVLTVYSSVRSHTNQHQDQRSPEANRGEEKGEGECGRPDETEGRP